MERIVEDLAGSTLVQDDEGNYLLDDKSRPMLPEEEVEPQTATEDAPAAPAPAGTVTLLESELAALQEKAGNLEFWRSTADREALRRTGFEREKAAMEKMIQDPTGEQEQAEKWLRDNLPKALAALPPGALLNTADARNATETRLATDWVKGFAENDREKILRVLPQVHGLRQASGFKMSYPEAFGALSRQAAIEAEHFGVASKPTPSATPQQPFTEQELKVWGFAGNDSSPMTHKAAPPSLEEKRIFGF